MPPAPGSSRDWMREQPSWRQMDGQGRAFPGNGNLAERRGRREAVQENNFEKREQVQQQIVGCFPQQVDHLSSNQQVEATPAFPIQQFAGESSLPMTPVLNQRVFPVAAFNVGFAPGAVNYPGTTPIIIYQPSVPTPQPPFCYTGALPMPYYTIALPQTRNGRTEPMSDAAQRTCPYLRQPAAAGRIASTAPRLARGLLSRSKSQCSAALAH